MDCDIAEYLLSMASSHEAMQTGLLREIAGTLNSGAFLATYRLLYDGGHFELSPANEVIGISPRGFELLRELRSQERARRKKRKNAVRTHRSHANREADTAYTPGRSHGPPG